ncbi:hypothetical protein SCYZ1_51 [Pseudomonas phage SCYZ1]|nr:hypothetical protein SCYZ1_51 [Pseudomonas phage SCYZ1]
MSDTPDLTWDNPFLRNIPMVAIVRMEGPNNGSLLTTPDTKSQRVFFRIGNNRTFPSLMNDVELMPTTGGLSKVLGFDDLLPLTLR